MAATGAEIASAYIALTVKAPGLKRDLAKEFGGIDASGAGKRIGEKLAAGVKTTMKVAGVAVGAIFGAAIVKGFGRLKAIENAQAKLKGLGNDGKATAKIMENALASVKGTSFMLDEAATTAAGAVAAGIKPGKELEGVLKTVANTAAAAGIPMEEMGSIFNNVAANTVAYTDDIKRLSDRGLPMWQSLADVMGVSRDEVGKLASSGKIDFATFAEAAKLAGGTVADELGKTTTGSFDIMMAALSRFGAKLLEDIYPLIGPLFQSISKWLDETMVHIEPVVAAFGTWLKEAIDNTSTAMQNASKWFKDNEGRIAAVAIAISAILLPVFIRLGVQALVSGVKQVAAWTMSGAGAIKTGVIYVAQSYKMIGTWVAQSIAAAKSGAETVAIWAMLRADSIKTAAVQVASTARMIGSWALLKVAPITNAIAVGVYTAATKTAAIAQKALNLVMRANPLGLIVTAIMAVVGALTWFFTSTDTGKAIWQGFMTFLSEAWTNIVSIATTTWEALGTFFTGLWDGIKSVFSTVVNWIVDMFMNWTVYGLIIQNWDAISQFFVDLWEGIKGFFRAAIDWLVDMFMNWTVYGLIIKNWDAIKQFFVDVWNGIVLGIQTAINWVSKIISDGVAVVKMVWDRIWNGLARLIATVWEGIKNTVATMITFITTKPGEAFEAARDAIGKAWKGIQDLAKKPVKFVVETVIGGLIDTINKIPGVNLAKPKLPKGFSEGGYTGAMAASAVAGVVHGNEHVIRAPSRKAIEARHPGLLDHMNQYGNIPGFKRGGLVNPLPKDSYSVSQQYHGGHNGIDLAAAHGTKIMAAGKGTVGLAGNVPMGGKEIYIQHENGLGTRYSHLSSFATSVGAKVNAGQQIGKVGSTGMSTGPHLHYMVHNPGGGGGSYGNHTNPASYMGVDGGPWSVLDGLADWATSKFKAAFPGSDMWVDAAGGLMKDAVKGVVNWATGRQGVDDIGSTLYDRGGWLQPGVSLVENRTGRPEPILTGSQWDAMTRGGGSDRPIYVQNPFTGEYLLARVDDRADGRIGAALAPMSAGAVMDRMGVR